MSAGPDIAGLAAVALRDLTRHCPDHPVAQSRLRVDAGEPDDMALVHVTAPSGFAYGFSVGTSSDPAAEILCRAADCLQDFVIEETWRPAPPCAHPAHAHPMSAEVRDGRAVWLCPADEALPVRPVGSLT